MTQQRPDIEKSTGMIVDGIFASQVWDSSGEVLDVENCDISDMTEGRGLANYEHRNDESDGANSQDIVGKIVFAKKVFKESDCEDDREKLYWKKVKVPFIYGMVRLYDGAGHLSAQGLAAQIRDAVANDEQILVRFSIDGSTIEKQGNVLKYTLGRRVAMTIKPCNKTCDSGMVVDPNAPEGWPKKDSLAKSENPADIRLGSSPIYEMELLPQVLAKMAKDKPKSIKVQHYSSQEGLTELDPAKQGTGNVGAERNRPNRIPRAYLYTNPGQPEAQIVAGSSHRYAGELPAGTKLYDLAADPHGLLETQQTTMPGGGTMFNAPDLDEVEREIQRRGYHGYTNCGVPDAIAYFQKLPVSSIPMAASKLAYRQQMKKALTAGGGNGAPGSLTGGAALQREDLSTKIAKVIKAYDETKGSLKDFIKSQLPDVSDEYLDHFTDLADEVKTRLKKAGEMGMPPHVLLSGDAAMHPRKIPGDNASVLSHLQRMGEDAAAVTGHYGAPENSILVHNPKDMGAIKGLARDHGQDSVLISDGRRHKLLYVNGPNAGQYHPGEGTTWHPQAPADNYTKLPDGRHFTHSIDFGALMPDADPLAKADTSQPPADRIAHFRQQTNRSVHETADDIWGSQDPHSDVDVSNVAFPPPDAKVPATASGATHSIDDDDDVAGGKKGPLTIRGKPVAPNPSMTKGQLVFNEHTGDLHTPQGAYRMYNPDADGDSGKHFRTVWHSPEVRKQHDYAVGNWIKLNKAMKAGTLPEAVLATAVAFSQLSPNTPVPVHEMMYAYLLDTFKHKGFDIRDPRFADPKTKEDWLSRDQPQGWPQSSQDYFTKEIPDLVTNQANSLITSRQQGDRSAFMLPHNKFDNMARYAAVHDHMKDLVARHGVDARSAVAELMKNKTASKLWEAARDRAVKAGKPDIGPYRGLHVPGLAPKTARFAYSMMGAGNSFVPDTHFSRHLFGLDKAKDASSIGLLRNKVLWNEKNSELLNAMDRWYFRNHPAVKLMLEHPEYGSYFKANPEQAVFPAFWGHWLSIAPHERLTGHRSAGQASNQAASHRPLFEEVDRLLQDPKESARTIPARTSPLAADPAPNPNLAFSTRAVKKSEGAAGPLIDPRVAAAMVHTWMQEHGEGEASFRYYAQLLPLLMHEGVAAPDKTDSLLKMEALTVDIKAATMSLRKDDHSLEQKVWKGTPQGSSAKTHDIRPPPQTREITPTNTAEAMEAQARKAEKVKASVTPRVVFQADHGIHSLNNTAEQQTLIHGLDSSNRLPAPSGADQSALSSMAGTSRWLTHPDGRLVFAKKDSQSFDHGAIREVAYHNLARDFFGLGRYVPLTAMANHPEDGSSWSFQEAVPNAEHFHAKDPRHKGILKALGDRGELHKLAFMNAVLGNTDRHAGNYVFDQDGIKMIDHGHTFADITAPHFVPHYQKAYERLNPFGKTLHPQAADWIRGLDAEKLRQHALDMGMNEGFADKLAKNLHFYKSKWLNSPGVLPRPHTWT